MPPESPLDDPGKAAFAWARYKRMMLLVLIMTIGVITATIALIYDSESAASIHYYIATALGIGFVMLLTAGLMGLAFLSNGTGHDESVTDLHDENGPRD